MDAAPPPASVAAALVDAAPPVPPKPAGPPPDLNVILISIDSLRADMPWSGYPREIAPRLTALEKRSVSYTNAYSISSYTAMSLGGLLGGKLPAELKRDGYFFSSYPKENLFFPELLQKAQIRTMSAQAHGYFRDPSFQQGFDKWEIVPNITFKNTTDENITSPGLESLFEKQLSDPANDSGRFFAWVHFMDPHDQYLTHEAAGIPSYGPKLRDRYDNEVTFTDRYVGKLLDFIESRPWGKRTAIIVTADHGEALGEHKQWAHGFELWENLIRVPLFFYLPNAEPRRIEVARSAIDLAPTICSLLGVEPDPGFSGANLIPELYGAPAEAKDVVVDLPATSDSGRRRAYLHGKQKLIAVLVDRQVSMYDLEKDPDEKEPITKGDAFNELVERFKAFEKAAAPREIPSFACKEDCLNGAYMARDRENAAREAGVGPVKASGGK